tara:strand:- start:2179 stop:2751 length:573 start_codon:yes stop_codon:yes gene_type:complete
MKHIKLFKLLDLVEYVNEAYYTYDELGMKRDAVEKQAKLALRHQLPYSWDETLKQIKSFKDVSDADKGIKFEIKLKSGETIHMFKVGRIDGHWEFYLNKKKRPGKDDLYWALHSNLPGLEKYMMALKSHDFYYNYADDNRAYKSGINSQGEVLKYYDSLSNSDKKKAYKEYLKVAPKERKDIEFKNFTGI